MSGSGVIYQNIKSSPLFNSLLNHCFHIRIFTNIRNNRNRTVTNVTGNLFGCLLVNIRDDYLCSFLGKTSGNTASESRTGSSNKCNFILQTHFILRDEWQLFW